MTSPTTSANTSTVSDSSSSSVNALIAGTKWGGATGSAASVSFSFPWTTLSTAVYSGANGGSYSSLGEPLASVHSGLTAVQQTAAKGALQGWANVANLSFTEVAETTSNVGDIRFAWTSAANNSATGGQAWGWAYYPNSFTPSAGDVWISSLSSAGASGATWDVGSYNYMSLLHELGHALGLKHSFEDTPVLPAAQESRLYTVMSYTDAPNNLFRQVTPTAGGGYSFKYISVEPDTPMLYDIAAMQYLYGANQTYKTGNDVYTFDTRTPFLRTLWDAGGTDTISVSNFSTACTIDLQAGHFSKIAISSDALPPGYTGGTTPTYDGTANLAIAFGCVIENAIGGSGNDTLIGNDANNSLTGGAGNDNLSGGAGLDTAVFSGNRASYTVTTGTSSWTVSSSADGLDTLTSIERLKFADKTVALDINGSAGQAYRIYQAAFNRTPDNAGLKYWIGQMDNGTSLGTVAAGFVFSQEFQTLYGSNPTNADFLTRLYSNVLHRTPDQAGYAWWLGQLNTGAYTKTTALMNFSESPENQVGVIGSIQNGIELV